MSADMPVPCEVSAKAAAGALISFFERYLMVWVFHYGQR